MILNPPLFNCALPEDAVFHLLFGRMQVCIAVNIPQLILDCEMAGMNARHATSKEMARARSVGGVPVLLNDKGVYVELDGQRMLVLDGIIFHALFFGQRPESVIRGYLRNQRLPAKFRDRFEPALDRARQRDAYALRMTGRGIVS